MVGQFTKVKRDHEAKTVRVDVATRAFFTAITNSHDRDGYDYLDVGAKLELPGTPSSFGGVSGGGLWEIGLVMKSGAISWDGKRYFRGVAFWQSPVSEDARRVIRCHGPRSIFELAWQMWQLPQ